MVTHYDVLGVPATATTSEIRRAYHARARELHPDRQSGRSERDVSDAGRAMQAVNEAWRVLGGMTSRADYDRSLLVPRREPDADDDDVSAASADEPWLDRPYPQRPAEPGDLTIAVVRAAPWIAVIAVLAALFVFTAFARRGGDDGDVIGRCVRTNGGVPDAVSCESRNDGRVVEIVFRADQCAPELTASASDDGRWYCLQPADAG